MSQQENNSNDIIEEELKDKNIGDIFKGGFGTGKKVGNILKDGVQKMAKNIDKENILLDDKDYILVMNDTEEITKGSRGLIIAATVIGPFAGPMAVMFSVDMDETQFKIISAVLVANALASIITAWINDLNLRSTAKNVARTAYYKFKNKFTNGVKDKEYMQEKYDIILEENETLKAELKVLEDYKFKKAVEEATEKKV